MELIDRIFLIIHIAAGTLSLIVFWIPMLARKGSKLHVISGKVYVWGMWIVVVTAAILCLFNLIGGEYESAGFLGFISILTLAPLWYGVRVIRHKKGITLAYFQVRRFLHAAILLSALGLLVWGAFLKYEGMAILMLIFGLLGLTSFRDVFTTFDKIKSRPWLVEHLSGMLGTAIAAHTAFLVFGGQSLFGHIFHGQMVVVLWVTPGVVGSIVISRYTRKYWPNRRKISV